MAQEFAKAFYNSPAWIRTRKLYAKSKDGLCECCLAKGYYRAGEIVHHKIHLTPDNINNPMITLHWSNLQLVCRDCHAELHKYDSGKKRYRFDADGNVIEA